MRCSSTRENVIAMPDVAVAIAMWLAFFKVANIVRYKNVFPVPPDPSTKNIMLSLQSITLMIVSYATLWSLFNFSIKVSSSYTLGTVSSFYMSLGTVESLSHSPVEIDKSYSVMCFPCCKSNASKSLRSLFVQRVSVVTYVDG